MVVDRHDEGGWLARWLESHPTESELSQQICQVLRDSLVSLIGAHVATISFQYCVPIQLDQTLSRCISICSVCGTFMSQTIHSTTNHESLSLLYLVNLLCHCEACVLTRIRQVQPIASDPVLNGVPLLASYIQVYFSVASSSNAYHCSPAVATHSITS